MSTAISATILGLQGPILEADEALFFEAAQPWGFILFARNIETPAQVIRLCGDLRAAVGRDAPILIDQEGGRVQRMRGPHWREWRPALDQVMAAGDRDAAARSMYLRARLIGAELREVGIDVNCAPLADVARDVTHPILRNRLYGETPGDVARIARAVADGLSDSGVLPVLKHLPGYGLATVDSHETLPRVEAPPDVLDAVDFAAFRPFADLALGMTAHVVIAAVDPDRPATLSDTMIRLIREEIGFGGLSMTDDLSMGALPGSIADRAAAALAAGCDLILHCNGDRAEMEDVLSVTGPMPADAVARGARALTLGRSARPLDIAAAEAELSELLSGEVYV